MPSTLMAQYRLHVVKNLFHRWMVKCHVYNLLFLASTTLGVQSLLEIAKEY